MSNKALSLRLLVSFLALSFNGYASAEIVKINDLVHQGQTSYQARGNDPYIVFSPIGTNRDSKFLLLDVASEQTITQLQVFFKQSGDSFDPSYRLDFKDITSTGKLALKIPSSVFIAPESNLRLDIDGCTACVLEIGDSINPSTSNKNLPELIPSGVFNGVNSLPNAGLVVSAENWQFNAVTGSLTKFEISSHDPYLVSPKLSLGTDGLAALYVQLKAPDNHNIHNDFQLFYATENHGFTEQASSHIRAQNVPGQKLELLFPLDFLSTQAPRGLTLEKIRLDLPLISGSWSLDKVSLISDTQLSEYTHLWPTQLIQNKTQRATGLSLIKKSISNIFSDTGFAVSYMVLIILISAGFVRAFNK